MAGLRAVAQFLSESSLYAAVAASGGLSTVRRATISICWALEAMVSALLARATHFKRGALRCRAQRNNLE